MVWKDATMDHGLNSGDWIDGSHRGVLKAAQKKKTKLYTILVVVSLIPIVFLCGLTLFQLIRSAQIRNDASDARESAINFINIARTVTSLQIERGSTARNIRSGGTAFSGSVLFWRGRSDGNIENMDFSGINDLPPEINTKEKLKINIAAYRKEIDEMKHSSEDVTIFYNDLIAKILQGSQTTVQLPSRGNLWRMMGAAVLLVRATNPSSALASYTRTFTLLCDRSKKDISEYLYQLGDVEAIVNQAGSIEPSVREHYSKHFENVQLKQNMDNTVNLILSDQFQATCRNFTQEERRSRQFPWFEDFVTYYLLILTMRNDLIDKMTEELDTIVYDEENIMMMYIVLFLLVALVCIVLTLIQIRGQARIVDELVTLATRSKITTFQLTSEKKKADLLLYRMIPTSVAEQLKSGLEVLPQQFESVSICYIDIVNFVAMISRMEPIQVTNMMRSLYKMFDGLLDEHKVYKTEQSNDVYSVVSGVPDKIDTHVAEIANFTIELMKSIETFRVDVSNEKIEVRIGVHTGPCAAGVIGHKSLRYSIFGESVKMASRMSRKSAVQKIQISRETKDALFKYGDVYIIKDRGQINIYGVGNVKTYFLEGHRSGRKIPGMMNRS